VINTLKRYVRKIVQFRFDANDMNWHGPKATTLRSTWQIVRMGSYAKTWRLYVYHVDGSWTAFEICFPFWRGPWPKSAGNEPRRGGE